MSTSPTERHPSVKGLRFIEGWEDFVSPAADDGFGNLTLGYGTTSADRPISPGEGVTREKAEHWLKHDLNHKYMPYVPPSVIEHGKQCELDAGLSLVYNEGPTPFVDVEHSGLARRLRYKRARFYWYRKKVWREELPRWCYANGHVVYGLQRRRAAELAMAVDGDYSGRP